MDKITVESESIVHEQEKYTILLLWEEGTENYSVELWHGLFLLFAQDWLLLGQARELYDDLLENIADYAEKVEE